MKTIQIILSSLGAVCLLGACAAPLVGTVAGTTYTGAHKDYSVPLPVSPEAGGKARGDDQNGVTFSDDHGQRVSYYSYVLRADEARSTRTLLEQMVVKVYRNAPTHFHPELRGGAITFAFVKNAGSYTGGGAFVANRHLYVVEYDPAPGMTFLAGWEKKSQAEVSALLEGQTLALLQKVQLRK